MHARKYQDSNEEYELANIVVMLPNDFLPNDKKPNEHDCPAKNKHLMKHNKSLHDWEKIVRDHCIYKLSLHRGTKLLVRVEFEAHLTQDLS